MQSEPFFSLRRVVADQLVSQSIKVAAADVSASQSVSLDNQCLLASRPELPLGVGGEARRQNLKIFSVHSHPLVNGRHHHKGAPPANKRFLLGIARKDGGGPFRFFIMQ